MASEREKDKVGGRRVGEYFDGPVWVNGTVGVGWAAMTGRDAAAVGSDGLSSFRFFGAGLTTDIIPTKVDFAGAPPAARFRPVVDAAVFAATFAARAGCMVGVDASAEAA